MPGEYKCDINRCRVKNKGDKENNYNFWIVDYFNTDDITAAFDFSFLDKSIVDFRNEGVTKVRYFLEEEEAKDFVKGLEKKGGE